MPFVLSKVTRTLHPKRSEHDKELTTHLRFSSKTSDRARLEIKMVINRTLHWPFWPPLPDDFLCTDLLSAQQLSAAFWIANQSTQSLWHRREFTFVTLQTCTLVLTSLLSQVSALSLGSILSMSVSHPLPALHKCLFPREALLLSEGL